MEDLSPIPSLYLSNPPAQSRGRNPGHPVGVHSSSWLLCRGVQALLPVYCDTFPLSFPGLRKKTRTFMGENYLDNFVQATFDALADVGAAVKGGTLVVSGDGRYAFCCRF